MLSGCAEADFGLPSSVSSQGEEVAHLWRLFATVALVIGLLVWGLIGWSVIAYRRRGDELPKQTHFNIPIEIAYTAIPFVIVAFLFAATMRGLTNIERKSSRPDVVIEVTGFQWQWRFHYPNQGINVVGTTDQPAEMVVPAGAKVRVSLTSTDVIHAFYVPEFLVKHDAIPGRRTQFDLEVTETGNFPSGRCAEFCGLNHDRMTFTVRALPRAEFDAWASSASAASVAGRESGAAKSSAPINKPVSVEFAV